MFNNKSSDYYTDLINKMKRDVEGELPRETFRQIRVDAPRSGLGSHDKDGVDMLRRVLQAYALRNPQVGYVQGLNVIVATCLRARLSEEQSFWVLSVLVERWCPQYYVVGLPGVKCDLRVILKLIQRYLPAQADVMKRIDANSCSVWVTSMLMTLFQNNLNEVSARRLWDMMFVLGIQKHMVLGMVLAFVGENAPIFAHAKNRSELDIALLDRVRSLRQRLDVTEMFLKSLEWAHKFDSKEIEKLRQDAMHDIYDDDDDASSSSSAQS